MKQELSDLMEGEKTTVTPTLLSALKDVIRDSPTDNAPKKLRQLVEVKVGEMVPQQLWAIAKRTLLEMLAEAAFKEKPVNATTAEVRQLILDKYGIQLKKPKWKIVKNVWNDF